LPSEKSPEPIKPRQEEPPFTKVAAPANQEKPEIKALPKAILSKSARTMNVKMIIELIFMGIVINVCLLIMLMSFIWLFSDENRLVFSEQGHIMLISNKPRYLSHIINSAGVILIVSAAYWGSAKVKRLLGLVVVSLLILVIVCNPSSYSTSENIFGGLGFTLLAIAYFVALLAMNLKVARMSYYIFLFFGLAFIRNRTFCCLFCNRSRYVFLGEGSYGA
jgi:hypothetical protein